MAADPQGVRAAEPSMSSDDAKKFWARTLLIAGIFLVATTAILYSARRQKDFQSLFDEQLETEWLTGRELVDAGEFLTRGGTFKDAGKSADAAIDQKYVRPLIDRLDQKHGLKLQALLELNEPNLACALVAEAPQDRRERNAVRATVLEMADAFPGFLYQHWGRRWVAFEFLDQTEIKPLEKSGALAKLKASQRRMD